jgi:diguanylate cyclase (GGDEF)-like protein
VAAEWDDETHVSTKQTTARAAGSRDRAYLIVLAGSSVGEMFKIAKPEVVIGRGKEADLPVLDEGVSRKHAAIRTTAAGMAVEDLGSRNGTFVNGEQVTSPVVLRDGDKIQVGSTTILKFTYHDNLDESYQRQMYDSALRDGLTKAFNKKYFLDRMESEFRFAKRHNVPLSLVMMDIDHFKDVNDSHGHLAGDMVLKSLAGRVHEAIRKEDVFARYGGEEFALLCRAIELDRTAQLAERIRVSLEGFAFVHNETRIPVTVSMGVAALPEHDAEDALGLIAAADGALYTAKKNGRNQVVVASANLPPA